MDTLRYTQVDVFGEAPMRGNPVAIVHCNTPPTDQRMLEVAQWLGLSETVFLLPPTNPAADYRVRIWSTLGELPFAGHPTLGACRAWIQSGGLPRGASVLQQCGAGLVEIRRGSRPFAEQAGCSSEPARQAASMSLAFKAPPLLKNGPLEPELLTRVCDGLGLKPSDVLDAAWVDNGAGWLALRLPSHKHVLAVVPEYSKLHGLAIGIIGPVHNQEIANETLFESRAFIAGDAVPEDPATGSLQAGIGSWFARLGVGADTYTVQQGTCLGRAGRITVQREHDEVWVGGSATTCIDGTISFDTSSDERHP
ncbi:PhzF family phenazine biosynthesis protein [Stenotrophomonas sp. SAU14A_NAIMI4_8]|uniref:PhzF family phenazine biosynthesis protein n=1 Tax=Stenotrophomonas sp. SAU14A_NAIMI4_8 TaxID=2072409 RepID=UPI000D5424A2|nr:PhzF family phenazine biosynthesis protein [Stenotrophomonas sp. SAU14A_NAIMI4_8]AWH33929.1 phenazine biosynthesis protein PhzF [Stenotrophomonas sp. SAU14A_NAIMI4_8]